MAEVIIALGSNVGNRHQHLIRAKSFLESLSANDTEIEASSIYQSEAVGPSERPFLNAVIRLRIEDAFTPYDLLSRLKSFEADEGRDLNAPRWSERPIDLDIIAWDDLVLRSDNLIIPHPEYTKRLFVLLPLKDLQPEWEDIETGKSIDQLITEAPELSIRKTELTWQSDE